MGTAPTSLQRLLDALDGIAWIVDRDGIICAVGVANWRDFAIENGAIALADPANVLGRPLQDFVDGAEVHAFWRRAAEEILSGERDGVVLPSSCDAPHVGREMRMAISPIGAGDRVEHLLFQSVTLAEHQRPPIDLYNSKMLISLMRGDPSLPILTMCSLCQMVRYPLGSTDADGAWITAEEHYRRGGDSRVRISHGVCPNCYERLGSAATVPAD